MLKVSGEYGVEDLYVPRELLLERLADPLGGVALIETGVDVTGLLQSVARKADKLMADSPSEQKQVWGMEIEAHPMVHVGGYSLRRHFPYRRRILNRLAGELADIERPLTRALMNEPEQAHGHGQGVSLFAIAMRRSFLSKTHVDQIGQVTLWLGATQPGLRVMIDGAWREVPNVPPAHALVWRAADAYHDGKLLEPIPHYAQYRSRRHRAILVS